MDKFSKRKKQTCFTSDITLGWVNIMNANWRWQGQKLMKWVDCVMYASLCL